jgi:predicted enzyme related to lactoylglutathione lyase
MIDTESAPAAVPIRGSLQQRRSLVPGLRTNGFECTISVDDIEAAAASVVAHGGTIVMPVCTLPGIGRLFFFQDPEGNQAGAMHYDETAQ